MINAMEHSPGPGRKSGVMSTLVMERPEAHRQVILDLRKGSREALGTLMDLHGEDLMRYLFSLVGDRESAEDAFQDTWVRVMEKARSFDPSGEFAPWVFRIARNRAMDILRRKAVCRARSLEEGSLPARAGTEQNDFIEKEKVRSALGRLPARHREILGLRFYLEKSYEEISTLLRIPMGTVKSRLKRALEHLARMLHEENSHDR